MTLQEFLTELRETRKSLNWLGDADTLDAIRCAKGDCPITAIANKDGHQYDIGSYREAARSIYLFSEDATFIVSGADMIVSPHSACPICYNKNGDQIHARALIEDAIWH